MAFQTLALLSFLVLSDVETVGTKAAFATIVEEDVISHIEFLAAPELEGRDSPSRGLERAARYIAELFAASGLEAAPDAEAAWRAHRGETPPPEWSFAPEPRRSYLRPFATDKLSHQSVPEPRPDGCRLELTADGETTSFELGKDFVPIAGCEGSVTGELVFAGFGISSKKERYNDLKSAKVRGKVALVFEGEPSHKKRFDGEEITPEASLWKKLEVLEDARAVGVILIRRPPAGTTDEVDWDGPGFRHTRASWVGFPSERTGRVTLPAVAVSPECATRLLGQDATALAAKIDKTARPAKVRLKDVEVKLESGTRQGSVVIDNVVGVVRGTDEALKDEWIVLGAHYDHIGIDARGRIGLGADDNASGTAALIECAQAFAAAPTRRSIAFVAFAAEEDGLIGSKRFCSDLPVDKAQIVAMLNMDMIGRGPDDEVVLLGVEQNPELEDVVKRGQRLFKTGIKKLNICRDPGLFERSDHYSFHAIGIPSLFLFENYPISENKDYHTWRDTVDLVNMRKVTRTARLAFTTAKILGDDDTRPPRPRD